MTVLFFIFGFASFGYGADTDAPPADKVPIEIPTADFSDLKHTKSGRIDKVIDGLTVLLKDGTIIRLASLHIPDFHIWDDAPYSEQALELITQALPEGTDIMFYQTRMAKKGRINRMKQQLGHILVKKNNEKDALWIQGLLLSHGLAQTYNAAEAPEMVDQMLAAEQTARAAQRGFWAQGSDYTLRNPESVSEVIGEFAVIEGIVQKTASVRNNIYLNFGADWKTDFTVMITPALRKALARKGIDPLGLSQKNIRVRGMVREYNGALIELKDVHHLEYPLNPPLLQSDEELDNIPSNP